MKKLILLIALFIAFLTAFPQDQPAPAVKPPATDSRLDTTTDSTTKNQEKAVLKNRTGNRSAIFSNIASFFGSSNNSLTLNPTLWGLGQLFKNADSAKYSVIKFKRNVPLENTQLNFAISPENKTGFKVDSGTLGFTYAIMNNTILKSKAYAKLKPMLDLSRDLSIFLSGKLDGPGLAKILESNFADSLIPAELQEAIKSRFHITGKIKDALDYKSLVTKALQRTPVWTVSFRDNYNFALARTNLLAVASDFSIAAFPINKNPASIDVSTSYKWESDSAHTTGNLSRNIFSAALGLNIQPWNWFEIKPAFSYVNTQGPLYAKESAQSINGSLTFRFKITDNFWLPISLQYTPHNGQILGFLSLQYSL